MRVGVAVFVLPMVFFANERPRWNHCTIPDGRAYADLAALLREPHLRLDTVPLAGTRELTVHVWTDRPGQPVAFGKPSSEAVASASSVCRVAALWTSRGDSLAVNWLIDPDVTSLEVASDTGPLTLADQPRPVGHTTRAFIRSESMYHSMRSAALESAAGETGTGQTSVMTLINEEGVPVLARLLRGSGVRRLDEAALRIMTAVLTTAPDDAGVPVAVWYVAHIDW